jgi:hypothetical protein
MSKADTAATTRRISVVFISSQTRCVFGIIKYELRRRNFRRILAWLRDLPRLILTALIAAFSVGALRSAS